MGYNVNKCLIKCFCKLRRCERRDMKLSNLIESTIRETDYILHPYGFFFVCISCSIYF